MSIFNHVHQDQKKNERVMRFDSTIAENRYDELYKERQLKRQHHVFSTPFIGACMDKCPEFERHERELHLDLSVFEMVPGTEVPKAAGDFPRISHDKAVKKYHRPAAGNEAPLPEDVRPPSVLQDTLDYLMCDVLLRKDHAFTDIHQFIRDRTRSIRQDLTVQNIRDASSIRIHEIIARFHILSGHVLCEEDSSSFDSFQNTEQLRKVLQTLQELYDDHHRLEPGSSQQGSETLANEAEFRSYYILTHLQDNDVYRKSLSFPPPIFSSAEVQFSLGCVSSAKENNYYRFFRLIETGASSSSNVHPVTFYLQACLLHGHFRLIRRQALKTLCKVYKSESIPLSDLVSVLGFDDEEEAYAYFEHFQLELTRVPFLAVLFHDETSLAETEPIRPKRSRRLVDAIQFPSLQHVMYHLATTDQPVSLSLSTYPNGSSAIAQSKGALLHATKLKPLSPLPSSSSSSSRPFAQEPKSLDARPNQVLVAQTCSALFSIALLQPIVNEFCHWQLYSTLTSVQRVTLNIGFDLLQSSIQSILQHDIILPMCSSMSTILAVEHVSYSFCCELLSMCVHEIVAELVSHAVVRMVYQQAQLKTALKHWSVKMRQKLKEASIYQKKATFLFNLSGDLCENGVLANFFSHQETHFFSELKSILASFPKINWRVGLCFTSEAICQWLLSQTKALGFGANIYFEFFDISWSFPLDADLNFLFVFFSDRHDEVKRIKDVVLLYHQSVTAAKRIQTPHLCQAICFDGNGPEQNVSHLERVKEVLYDGPLNAHSVTLEAAPTLLDWIPRAIDDWQRYFVASATFWDIWYASLLYDFIKPLQISFSNLLSCSKVNFVYAQLFVDLFNYLLSSTRSMSYISTPFDFQAFYLPTLVEPGGSTGEIDAHLMDYLSQLGVYGPTISLPFISDTMCSVIDETIVKMDRKLSSLSYFHHLYMAWKENYKSHCETRIQTALRLVLPSPQKHPGHASIKKRRHSQEACIEWMPDAKRESLSFTHLMLQEIHHSKKESQDYQSYLERILKE